MSDFVQYITESIFVSSSMGHRLHSLKDLLCLESRRSIPRHDIHASFLGLHYTHFEGAWGHQGFNSSTSISQFLSGWLYFLDLTWARTTHTNVKHLLFWRLLPGRRLLRHASSRGYMSYMDTTQFASKPSASIISFNPSCKVYQASFKVYKSNNEDRTVVLKNQL